MPCLPPSLPVPADGPSSLAPLPTSMPSNLGIGEHQMVGSGLHHGLPSSGSMGNLQAMQVRARGGGGGGVLACWGPHSRMRQPAGVAMPCPAGAAAAPPPHTLAQCPLCLAAPRLLQAGIPLAGMHGLHLGSSSDMHMMNSAAMMMAAAHAQAHGGGGGSPPGGHVGRGGAIKLGRGVADPSAYAHKLFIGQIPFEVRRAAAGAHGGPQGRLPCYSRAPLAPAGRARA